MPDKESDDLVEGILANNRRSLAKAITLVESMLPAHQKTAELIIEKVLPHTGQALRIGISGIPGAGKSTFIESFGMYLLDQGKRIAVLTVDPSSKSSGGSILADKTRMERLSTKENAFIRPSPAGETLGGVARKTRESMLLCEAAGYDVILVETVGVGQSESAVSHMVDFFLLILLAGAGDELQGIKRGILELIDALVINKTDGDNIEASRQAQTMFEQAFHFIRFSSAKWSPPVLLCSALLDQGIERVWRTIERHHTLMINLGEFEQKRRRQAVEWMWSLIDDGLKRRFLSSHIKDKLSFYADEVMHGEMVPTRAASDLLELFDQSHRKE